MNTVFSAPAPASQLHRSTTPYNTNTTKEPRASSSVTPPAPPDTPVAFLFLTEVCWPACPLLGFTSDSVMVHLSEALRIMYGACLVQIGYRNILLSESLKAEGDSLNNQLFMNKYICPEGKLHKTMGWQWLVI